MQAAYSCPHYESKASETGHSAHDVVPACFISWTRASDVGRDANNKTPPLFRY